MPSENSAYFQISRLLVICISCFTSSSGDSNANSQGAMSTSHSRQLLTARKFLLAWMAQCFIWMVFCESLHSVVQFCVFSTNPLTSHRLQLSQWEKASCVDKLFPGVSICAQYCWGPAHWATASHYRISLGVCSSRFSLASP